MSRRASHFLISHFTYRPKLLLSCRMSAVQILNIGILAHVDAGKTSLTERMLYSAGAIKDIGSVNQGSTQTDSMALEKQRGITIQAAVASFYANQVSINIIDTPGHPDFIAEVERSLRVLDAAVLVVSAVEGVQAQTRILMRALRRLKIPTLIFVNKIDRRGAKYTDLLQQLRQKLMPALVPMGTVHHLGQKEATWQPFDEQGSDIQSVDGHNWSHWSQQLLEALAEENEAFLRAFAEDNHSFSLAQLQQELKRQTALAQICPVYFGSAITGAGVTDLIQGITDYLPSVTTSSQEPSGEEMSGRVFKVERGKSGEKIAYIRMFSGQLSVRDRLSFAGRAEEKVTMLQVYEQGKLINTNAISAGQIGKVWGLHTIRMGDPIGQASAVNSSFAPPPLEAVVKPRQPEQKAILHAALAQLAEQDPLISLRLDENQQLCISLYGEVQKEVIEATLLQEFNVEAVFSETSIIYVERPLGRGQAVKGGRPFVGTVGLRVEPALSDQGLEYALEVQPGALPAAFFKAIEESVRKTLQQGLCGWEVINCRVTVIRTGYCSIYSSAGDFRGLTPLVLMEALQKAQTQVCQPFHRFSLEIPLDTSRAVLRILSLLGGEIQEQTVQQTTVLLGGFISASHIREFQQQLLHLTRGEGLLESSFDHYRPVVGQSPSRERSDLNPLNRKQYLTHLFQR